MLHLIQHTCTNKQYKKTVTHTTPGRPIVTYHTWTTVSDTNTPGQLPAAALDQLPEDNADKCIAAHREVEQ